MQFSPALIPAASGGLAVSSASLFALPIFLTSTVEAKATLSEIFSFGAREWKL